MVPFSEELFKQVSIEWLIATDQVHILLLSAVVTDSFYLYDQPLSAMEHPRFREMINLATRSKKEINTLGRKVARIQILNLFSNHLRDLKQRLAVSLSCS